MLSRVSGILAGRGFNIDSLVVCRTEIRDLSRMCIVLRGQDGVVEQARRQLEDLVSAILFGLSLRRSLSCWRCNCSGCELFAVTESFELSRFITLLRMHLAFTPPSPPYLCHALC